MNFYRDIPVDMKYIADPTMHSMPAVTLAPNQKWLGCQSMDNKIVIYSALNRFKLNRKKTFKGHMVAGYACGLDFSPEMRYFAFLALNATSPNCFFIATLFPVTLTARYSSGTGKQRGSWPGGRLTIQSAVLSFGTRTKPRR